jgi:16S rRNA (uracil1498-N3)-methyltransferase
MVRLRVARERISGGRAELAPEDAAYLHRVLRLRPGDRLEAFDGQGGAYPATIASLSDAAGSLDLGARQARVEQVSRLTLWQALPKAGKLEWVIQKCTELGVAEIVPFRSQRSVVKLAEARGQQKTLRWQKVAEQAARQCGRSDVPRIHALQAFDDLCALARGGARVGLLHAGEGEGLVSLTRFLAEGAEGGGEAVVAVGPEGGFDPGELEAARRAGASLLGLGRRVLRTETAGIVVCTLAAWLAGDLG